MSDTKEPEKKVKVPKVPLSVRFGEWFHHKPVDADDEDTYCGTRNSQKWRSILLFYTVFYGVLVCFWAICYAGMFANIPRLIGGPGPITNGIKGFGFVTMIGAVPDFSAIADDDGSDVFSGTGTVAALGPFRKNGWLSDYQSLQTAITTTTGVSGEQFLWNNCTTGQAGCAVATSNYGTFGPVYLISYRNRKWNRPIEGSTCAITCTYSTTFTDGTTATGTIADDHFWQLDFASDTWIAGNANLDSTPFQNQPTYRAYTAVSMEGLGAGFVSTNTISCSVANLENDSEGGVLSTFVA
eukprot:m.20248 g.20248  ORF g.20248 m.20248 type:complete len:297 (-) comp10163_c0_seq1:174-1064(-)